MSRVRVDGVRTRRETLIYAQVLFVVAAAVAALRGDGRSRSRGPNIRGGIRELHELVRTWNLFTSLYWCCAVWKSNGELGFTVTGTTSRRWREAPEI